MGPHIKSFFNAVDYVANKGFDLVEKEIIELEHKRIALIEALNDRAAIKRATDLGLKPTKNLNSIRTTLNERIIFLVKVNKLTHQELGDIAMIPRTRVTAIMNRHLERVSIDCMIKILDILGAQTTIQLS